jgi:hypothetical protein
MLPHPKKNTSTYRPFLERLGASSVTEFVGEFGEIFYDPADPTLDSLRISDGKTPGGVQLAGGLKDQVGDLFELVDADKLAEIQNIINSFLEVNIDEFTDITDRVEELELNAVKRTGDVMTGGLKIKNDSNYKLELLPEATNRTAGTLLFSQNDVTKGEIYWNPQGSRIDFSFPDVARGGDQVILEIGKPSISIYTKTDIQGDLFVHDINVLDEVNKVKLELAAELLGLSIALKTKYNKEGGDVFGPINVRPQGAAGLALFTVDDDGPQGLQPPSRPYSLTNKKYVDDKLAGLDTALVFKGSIDATTAYPTSVSVGDVWANNTDGTADAQWTGITDVVAGDLLARGENQWSVVGSGGTVPDLDGYVEIGDNVSDLNNDAGYVTKAYSDAEDEKIKDNVSSIIGEILVDLGNHDHVFNYHVVETSDNFNDGDMTAVDEDPIQNQMFLFSKNEIDGSEALFWNEVDDGDILIIEQDLGKRLRYEILSPASFLGDQVRLNVNYLDTDGTGASQFYFDRDAAIYINKVDGDRSDNATQDWTTTNFLKRAGDNVTDATETVEYKWNENVVISSTNNQEDKGITLKGSDGQLSILHKSSGDAEVRLNSGQRMYFESGHNFYITSNKGLDLKSQDSLYLMSESDIKFQSNGNKLRGSFTSRGLKVENSIESYDSASDYYRNKLVPTIEYVEHIAMPKNLNTLQSLPLSVS